ncbi:sulfotransferase domain-containing protein [Immundisolibacter sp.]|uniref:sulfotransferase domain-containing protein n=1 Tax=Immundisolibacter sp. TaxID=1934948 RepID=UPI0035694CCD
MVEWRDGWPLKTRELHNHHFDSTAWNDFAFRDNDIVIATYAKAGTTWTQQIMGQLVFGGAADVPIHDISPWLDLRAPPTAVKHAMLAAQQHRRFIKTHLPVDALVYSPRAKYIYIGRDGRDVVVSLYNHHASALPPWYQMLNETPGRVGPPMPPPADSASEAFSLWLEHDGAPFWPFFSSVRSWWEIRHLPNLLFLHYADLKRDLAGQMRRIADFLGIHLEPAQWTNAVEHCGFEYMRAHGDYAVPAGGQLWRDGASSFLHRGQVGRWRELLTSEQSDAYERRVLAELGAECAGWLAQGGDIVDAGVPA